MRLTSVIMAILASAVLEDSRETKKRKRRNNNLYPFLDPRNQFVSYLRIPRRDFNSSRAQYVAGRTRVIRRV